MDLNKVMIIGRVTQDPEIKTVGVGQLVATFSVATNRQWKDQNGQKVDRAEFHNVVAWRKLAEIIQQYVTKGSKIYIEGRLETRSWDDPAGVKKYRTEIVADNMIMLDSRGNAAPSSTSEGAVPPPSAPPEPAVSTPDQEISVEDIPF